MVSGIEVAGNVAKDELLRVPQVCEVLKISRTKLYEIISGSFPLLKAVRVGSSRRIFSRDLYSYMESLVD